MRSATATISALSTPGSMITTMAGTVPLGAPGQALAGRSATRLATPRRSPPRTATPSR
jgi:allophanate hydrolase subunit 1